MRRRVIMTALIIAGAANAFPRDGGETDPADEMLAKAARLEEEGRLADAVQLYGEILAAYPDHPRAYNNFGAVLLRSGKYDEAKKAFERATALDPSYPTPLNNLGYLYLLLEDYVQSESYLSKAAELDPNNESTLNNLRACYIVQDHYEEAAARWEKLAALAPSNARIRQDLSDIYLKLAKLDLAEKWARETAKLDPRNVEAHLNLALVMRLTGRGEEALAILDKAAVIAPDDLTVKVSRRDTLANLKRWEEARDAAQAVVDAEPSPENYYVLATILYELGEYDEGIAACVDGLARRDDAAGYSLLGYGYSLAGRLNEAEEALAKALARNDGLAETRRNLGDVFYQKGLYAAAKEQYDKAFQLEPANPWPLAMSGYCLFLLGDKTGAGITFEKVLATWPTNVKALAGLAAVRREEGKTDEALALATKAVELAPRNPDALNNLGIIYGDAGDFENSYKYLKKLVELGNHELYSLANLGVAAARTGRWKEARDAFEAAVALNPKDVQSQAGLGLAYAQLGEKKAAEQTLAAAEALAPDYPVALYARVVLAEKDGDKDRRAELIKRLLVVKIQWGPEAEKADALIKYAFEKAEE